MPVTFTQSKCRCQSATHGHAAGQCGNAATEADDYCKYCHDRAADEWLMANQQDWNQFKTETSTVVTSIASVTSSATEAGLTKVADAGERVQFIFVNIFEPATGLNAIPDGSLQELKIRIENLEKAAKKEGLKTETKRCHDEFERCLRGAKTKFKKIRCGVTYATCLTKELKPEVVNLINIKF